MEKQFYLLIAGGRDFIDYALLKEKCDFLLKNHFDKEIIIVNGLAKGADTLGKLYALEKGYKTKDFKPDWSIGKYGGIKRNQDMAAYIKTKTHYGCVCFWDGKSTGTKAMKDICEKSNIPYRVYSYIADIGKTIIGISKNNTIYAIFKNSPLTTQQQYLKNVLDNYKIFNKTDSN